MLTSFFGNSKTANYIILSLALPLALIGRFVVQDQQGIFTWQLGLALLGQSIILIFALLLLDFIVRKNKLTQTNTYGLWWFFCGLVTAADLGSIKQSLGLVFALLALRRMMSLFNEQNLEKKIFDAGHHHGSTYYEHLAFIDAIKKNSKPVVSLSDGLIAVAMGEAAEKSIKEKRLVNLDEILSQ